MHCWRVMLFIFGLMKGSTLTAKEIALSFDDAPTVSSKHFSPAQRSELLIRKLQLLKVTQAGIFANPCRFKDPNESINHLKNYLSHGHVIANHTCTHLKLDQVGYKRFTDDSEKADKILAPLMITQKFFRYPYLNEGSTSTTRDQMRTWLQVNKYKHGAVSIDNDDYLFSALANRAKEKNLKIDYEKLKNYFIDHINGAVSYYDELALKILGRSPKHVLLLHEMDMTVMFLEELLKTIQNNGWKIISFEEALTDPIYSTHIPSSYTNNGIIAQMHHAKTGTKLEYTSYEAVKVRIKTILGL